MTTVLIIGAGGFIGRHVAAQVAAAGAMVVDAQAVKPGRRLDLLDADDRAALIAGTDAEILIHCAWVTEHGRFWTSDLNVAWERASADLFQRFQSAGGRRIIGLGSCAEYDWTTGDERFVEQAPIRPHTLYGAAKARTATGLGRLAEETGISHAWGRIFHLFGPGEPEARLIPLMIRAGLARQPLDCGPGDALRDFWDVRNLGAAIAALAVSATEGAVNLASGSPSRIAGIGAIIEAYFGTEGLLRFNRRPLSPGEPMAIVADTGRLRGELNFCDPVSLPDGLRDCCRVVQKADRAQMKGRKTRTERGPTCPPP